LSDLYLIRVIAYQVKKYYQALDRQYNINFKGEEPRFKFGGIQKKFSRSFFPYSVLSRAKSPFSIGFSWTFKSAHNLFNFNKIYRFW